MRIFQRYIVHPASQLLSVEVVENQKQTKISLLFPCRLPPVRSPYPPIPPAPAPTDQVIRPLSPSTILDIWNNPQSWPCSKPMRVSETCALVKLLGMVDRRESWLEIGYKEPASCQRPPSENVALCFQTANYEAAAKTRKDINKVENCCLRNLKSEFYQSNLERKHFSSHNFSMDHSFHMSPLYSSDSVSQSVINKTGWNL